jgi:signal transduction histidine kinase
MYVRASNDDEAAKRRRAETAARVADLRARLSGTSAPEDGRLRLDLAGILAWSGQYSPVLELVQPIATTDYPWPIAAEARQMIADTHYRHERYDLAHTKYAEILELAQACGDDYFEAVAEMGIAWVLIDVGHFTSGEFAEAARRFECHTPLLRRLGMHASEGMGIYGMSRAAAGTGDYDRAIRLADESLSVLDKHGHDSLIQLPLLQLANVHRDSGAFDRARPYYERAIDASDRSEDAYVQVLTALSYGIMLRFESECERARELWQFALAGARELDFPRLGSEACEHLAALAADSGNFEEAYLRQIEGREFGNRVGVLSGVLQNQQLLLRSQIDRTAQLQAELSYLNTGVEASADGIFVLKGPEGDDFVVQFVNSAASQMLGRAAEKIHHVRLHSVWNTPSADVLTARSREVWRTGARQTIEEIELEFPSGPGWYTVKIAKIADGVAWSISDVAENVRMQREILAQRDRLEIANARLTALDREKSEMLGIAAHDLRSPIGNIKSLCELICAADEDSRAMLTTIESISDSLIHLIGDLLDVERIERGEMELHVGPVEVAPILDRIVDQFSAEARQKRIKIGVSASARECWALADPSALGRVIQNLVSNALKFSPTGSLVQVRLVSHGEMARVEIEDRGPGISETDQRRLFAKFAKLSARPTAGESSTGLGLSIVKRLVDAMGGRVGCCSVPDNVATFWLEFSTVGSPNPFLTTMGF